MKLNFKQTFPYPLDVVLRALDKREDRTDAVPAIFQCDIVENQWHDLVRKRKMRFGARLEIPSLFKKVLPVSEIRWVYEENWDLEKRRREWVILPVDRTKMFRCEGATQYEEEEENGVPVTVRRLKGELKVNLPLFGHLAEEALIARLRNDARKEHKMLTDIIENELSVSMAKNICVSS